MTAADLAGVVDGAPLVVCLGPGGVGKTTLAAVLALHQAATSARSLVLTIDPARRLADALGVTALSNDPVEVTSFRKMHAAGSLSALMLDPTATFDGLIGRLVTSPERRATLLGNRFYQHLSRSLAGTLEYMAVERLHELHGSQRFDRIVLDTPPTTNALDFLEAPDRIAGFFSERVTRWFMPSLAPPSWTTRLLNRAGSAVLSILGRIAGEEFVRETSEFMVSFADLLGHFRARGVEVGALLRDPRTVYLVICAPDPSRLGEAREIDRRLTKAGCRPRAFIVNRVDEAFLPGEQELAVAVARATSLLGGTGEQERVRIFLERLEALRQAQQSAAVLHATAVASLREQAGARPVLTAPNVPAGQSPRASLLALYVALFAGAAPPAAGDPAAAPTPWTGPERRAGSAPAFPAVPGGERREQDP
jgi:anion-transporting  ArsA/GET3 family ATPase